MSLLERGIPDLDCRRSYDDFCTLLKRFESLTLHHPVNHAQAEKSSAKKPRQIQALNRLRKHTGDPAGDAVFHGVDGRSECALRGGIFSGYKGAWRPGLESSWP